MDLAAHAAGFHALYLFPGLFGFSPSPFKRLLFQIDFLILPPGLYPVKSSVGLVYGINPAIAVKKRIADTQCTENLFFS